MTIRAMVDFLARLGKYSRDMSKNLKMPIYLDYNATTPLDPLVLQAMLPYFEGQFGNPSSKSHAYGWEASMAVEKARNKVAEAIGADSREIFFTSGATESNNIAILGLIKNFKNTKAHIITSNVEHKAVCDVVKCCEEESFETTFLPVDQFGQISAEQVEKAIRPNTKLISIMMANNEVGSINPIAEIGRVAKKAGVFFHTDAAQAFGKIKIDVQAMGIDLLSISGHKIYGPKGIGALYVRKNNPAVILKPLNFGGSQEACLRPGTLNVPAIVGLGVASEIALQNMSAESERITAWRDQIISEVTKKMPNALLNGHPKERLCNNVSFSFANLDADLFALGLSGLAVSSGSACSSGMSAGSYVIKALGRSEELARSTLRIGLGRFTTDSDVQTAITKILALNKKSAEARA